MISRLQVKTAGLTRWKSRERSSVMWLQQPPLLGKARWANKGGVRGCWPLVAGSPLEAHQLITHWRMQRKWVDGEKWARVIRAKRVVHPLASLALFSDEFLLGETRNSVFSFWLRLCLMQRKKTNKRGKIQRYFQKVNRMQVNGTHVAIMLGDIKLSPQAINGDVADTIGMWKGRVGSHWPTSPSLRRTAFWSRMRPGLSDDTDQSESRAWQTSKLGLR